jgi:hypothetical protein
MTYIMQLKPEDSVLLTISKFAVLLTLLKTGSYYFDIDAVRDCILPENNVL